MITAKKSVDLDVYFQDTLSSFIEKTAQEIPVLLRDKKNKSSNQYV